MKEIIKKISFAFCPRCFWLATYYERTRRICPNCNGRLSMQTVKVLAKMKDEGIQKEALVPRIQRYGSLRRIKDTQDLLNFTLK